MDNVIIALVTAALTSLVSLVGAYFKFRSDLTKSAQNRIASREKRYDELEVKWTARLNDQNDKLLKALQESKEECEEEIKNLENQLNTYRRKIDKYELSVDKYEEKLNGHNERLAMQQAKNSHYETELSLLRSGIVMLITQLRGLGIEPVWAPPSKTEG